jgi:hypothetical protein
VDISIRSKLNTGYKATKSACFLHREQASFFLYPISPYFYPVTLNSFPNKLHHHFKQKTESKNYSKIFKLSWHLFQEQEDWEEGKVSSSQKEDGRFFFDEGDLRNRIRG